MSIQNNSRYYIVNKKSGTVIDLDTRNNKTVQAWQRHGGSNQQWEFTTVEGGWNIKNVAQNTYLAFEGSPNDGARLICTPQPFVWNIWPDDDDKSAFRFCVPNTMVNIDLSDHGNIADGTAVQLWTRWNGPNQVWRVDHV